MYAFRRGDVRVGRQHEAAEGEGVRLLVEGRPLVSNGPVPAERDAIHEAAQRTAFRPRGRAGIGYGDRRRGHGRLRLGDRRRRLGRRGLRARLRGLSRTGGRGPVAAPELGLELA
jgi:hypothetical protein